MAPLYGNPTVQCTGVRYVQKHTHLFLHHTHSRRLFYEKQQYIKLLHSKGDRTQRCLNDYTPPNFMADDDSFALDEADNNTLEQRLERLTESNEAMKHENAALESFLNRQVAVSRWDSTERYLLLP